MLNKIRGLIRLTRYRDYLAFVTITTLMGAIAADASLSWKLILVLLAIYIWRNWSDFRS